jgi:hypothetical protein
MFNGKLYYGKVIDDSDPDEKGKIQVRLLPEMKDMTEADLPWLYPFLMENQSEEAYSHKPLEIGSTVWCIFLDEYFKYGFFIAGAFINDLFDFSSIKDDLGNISEIDAQEYPNPRFTRYNDGTIVFTNTQTGEMGIYHSTGSYAVFDSEGSATVYSTKSIKLYNDANSIELEDSGDIIQDSNGFTATLTSSGLEVNGNTKTMVTFEDLQLLFNKLLGLLDAHTQIDPLTGSTGIPQVPLTPQLTTDISNLQTTNVKTS